MKKIVILIIIVMVIGIVFLSGCTDKDEAKRRGEEYLKDKYVALGSGYAEILNIDVDEVDDNKWDVTIKAKVYSSGIYQTAYYSCYVEKTNGDWRVYE